MKYFKTLLLTITSLIIAIQVSGQDWRNAYTFTNFEKYMERNSTVEGAVDGKRVVFMGNSITEAWPILRPQFFENANYLGRGISGQTTPQMLLRFRRDVVNLHPNVVVILAGINDIAQNTGYTPIELIAENIMTMSDIAKSHDIKVIICSVTPAIDFPWNRDIKPVNKIIELNKLLERYAEKNDIPYVDYHTALKDEENGLSVPEFTTADDLVHPNVAGYIVMEKLVQPAIEKALRPSGLSVNQFYSDHMVLQQLEDVAVWGSAIAGHEVKVVGDWGEESVTTTNTEGIWKLELKTTKAGGPYKLEIHSNNKTIKINDVMIGEVWLASGQSNMSMPLKGWLPGDSINNSLEEIANAQYPNIRMFDVERKYSMEEQNTFGGSWNVCTPEHATDYSATAYFFARRMHKELNVPIGIIHSSWGGTPAEAWISRKKIKMLGDFEEMMQTLEDPETIGLTRAWYDRWETMPVPTELLEWNEVDLRDDYIAQPEFQSENWATMKLPGRIDLYEGEDMDGAFWFRKTIELDDFESDYTFIMGFTDDTDVVFINGKKIGATAYDFSNQRQYAVPKKLLREGNNTIAIRIIDTGGPGRITDDILLRNEKDEETSLNGDWEYAMTAELFDNNIHLFDMDELNLSKRPNIVYPSPYSTPSSLYNAMIQPLAPFNIKGAIWYQGESNVGRAEQYKRLFPSLIEDWRRHWNRELPFYFVQIAPYNYNAGGDDDLDESQYLRDAQRRTLSTENTGMVVTLDIGNNKNIHPANKQDVGARLAGLALSNDYERNITASGPLYRKSDIRRNKIVLEFDHVGSGLIKEHPVLLGFEIAGADKKYIAANAKIVGDKVEVNSSLIMAPKYVRYAWRDTSIGSLFNREGLPASSFTTE